MERTDILVLAPTQEKGKYQVVEAIKGYTPLATFLVLEGLTPPDGVTSRLSELAEEFGTFEAVPPVRETDRVIVFLRRPGAQPEYDPRPDMPASTDGWQPANWWGDLRTSAVWLQDGVTYAFSQTVNPGPSHLIALRSTEEKVHEDIRAVLRLRDSLDEALVSPDPTDRAKKLAVLVRSSHHVARSSALRHLEGGGTAAADALQELLSEHSLLPRHAEIVNALLKTGAQDLHLGQILQQETQYWTQACRSLQPHWFDRARFPELEAPRSHYGRVLAALVGIRQPNLNQDLPAVREFAAVWSTCPPMDENEPLESSQVSHECDPLLSPDVH